MTPGKYPAMRARTGFTLIELITTIAIVAVLLALAAPFFGNASLSGQLSANSNNLLGAMSMARSEAIKRNANVTLCMSGDGATCNTTGGWEQGWIVTAAVSGATSVLRTQPAAPSGYRITGTNSAGSAVSTITFPPIGLIASKYTFKVCRNAPTVGAQDRSLVLTTTGQISITRTATGTCS